MEVGLYAQLLGAAASKAHEWDNLQERARKSQWQDLSLVAMRQDAVRMREFDSMDRIMVLRALAARARELGLRSQQEEAERALMKSR